MRHYPTVSGLLVSAVFLAACATQAERSGTTDDPVQGSFERELHHRHGPAATVTREAIDDDLLYALINRPLHSADPGAGLQFAAREESGNE